MHMHAAGYLRLAVVSPYRRKEGNVVASVRATTEKGKVRNLCA
jgi:hypothetical protein